MKTKPVYLLLSLLLALGCLLTPLHAASGPVVSGVSFMQEVVVNPGARRVTVTYTLAHLESLPCAVFLEADRDGSGNYERLTAVSGAVGDGITSSPGGLVKTAVWDVGASAGWVKVLYPAVKIRVTASSAAMVPTSGNSYVTVGDPGNAADPTTSYGGVGYTFQIQKFEFTNAEYVEFLNAVGGSNPNAIYSSDMAFGGITQAGVSPNFTYAVKVNMGDKPVNYVSWFGAARVANWLHNGRSTNPALLETGAYTLNNATTGVGFTKTAAATYWVPSEDEWYKAAYYKGGGVSAGYWIYPTRSDTEPTYVTASPTGVGSAGLGSMANSINGFQVADWNGNDGNVTTVGSNGGPSAYGAYDMGGNVWELDDAVVFDSRRVIRGGAWVTGVAYGRSDVRSERFPANVYGDVGFRLARSSVPAPSVPTQLGLRTQPVGSASGGALSSQPVVELRNAQGSPVGLGSSVSVTVAIASGAGGSLGGTTTVTAVDGVATFANLTLSGTVGANYVLRFSAAGLTSVDSAPVNVTVVQPVISDPAGNLTGDTSRSFMDIVSTSIRSDGSNLVLDVQMAAPLPTAAQMTGGKRFDVIWFVDIDRNLATGQTGSGNDYNIHLYLDESGWHFFWFKVSAVSQADGIVNSPSAFAIAVSGDRATLTFPVAYLPSHSFEMWATCFSGNAPTWTPVTQNPATSRAVFNF